MQIAKVAGEGALLRHWPELASRGRTVWLLACWRQRIPGRKRHLTRGALNWPLPARGIKNCTWQVPVAGAAAWLGWRRLRPDMSAYRRTWMYGAATSAVYAPEVAGWLVPNRRPPVGGLTVQSSTPGWRMSCPAPRQLANLSLTSISAHDRTICLVNSRMSSGADRRRGKKPPSELYHAAAGRRRGGSCQCWSVNGTQLR